MTRTDFRSLSWNVSEPEYRKDPALSYSTLSKFERGGRFNSLKTLFDEVSSPSLTFGSMVDTLLTDGEEAFSDRFIPVRDSGISDKEREIAMLLHQKYKDDYPVFADIPDHILADTGKECDFWAADKYTTIRVKRIRENCASYYHLLIVADSKTLVTQTDISEARACVDALRNSGMTAMYFKDNDPFDSGIEGYYQLKFKGTDPETGINYRCMADRVIVNHDNGWVLPIDLKTSSHPEWEFHKSFTQWRYDIQARLYWRLIRQAMDKDPYFKEFKLMDYRFVVINRETRQPLVWEFPLTQTIGTLELPTPSGYVYRLRDPYKIGAELDSYLKNPRNLPNGIKQVNNIVDFIRNS